jgi:hypothetical protein
LEIRGKLIKKGGKHLTLPGKISFSVTLDQIQRFLFFSKIESIGGFPLKGEKITSLHWHNIIFLHFEKCRSQNQRKNTFAHN